MASNRQRAREVAPAQQSLIVEAVAAPAISAKSGQPPLAELAAVPVGGRLFSITAGLYSFAELIRPMLEWTGGGRMVISSWTCGSAEAVLLGRLLLCEEVADIRFVVDKSWPSRKAVFCQALVKAIGAAAIRLGKTHAKTVVIHGPKGTAVAHGSLNLNPNLRCETVCVERDTDVAKWSWQQWDAIADALPGGLQHDDAKIRELFAGFGISADCGMTDEEVDALFNGDTGWGHELDA